MAEEKTKYRLRANSWRLIIASVFLASTALIFTDPSILVLSAIPILPLLIETITLKRAVKDINKSVKIKPERTELILYPNKTLTLKFEVESSINLRANFEPIIMEGLRINFNPDKVMKGKNEVELKIDASLAGEYICDSLKLKVTGRLGLIESLSQIPTHIRVKVYPKVLAVAIEAAAFLLSRWALGYGEEPSPYRGAGLEYAESRDYVPGDTLRFMDWKATARLGRLIVKEFYVEGGLGVHLIYEATALNPYMKDELSTAFLNTVLALARQSIPMGMTIHNGREVMLNLSNLNPQLALLYALQYALKLAEVDPEELYSLLEPKTSRQLRRLLTILNNEALRRIVKLEMLTIKELLNNPINAVLKTLENAEGRLQILLITPITGDLAPILELSEKARMKGSNLLLLQPTKPWLSTYRLEEAYRLYRRYNRLYRILERYGVKVATNLKRVLEYAAAGTAKLVAK